eukprot:9018-Prymnesium_polylepis.1
MYDDAWIKQRQWHEVEEELAEPGVVAPEGGAVVAEETDDAWLVRLVWWVDDGEAEHQVLLILSAAHLAVLGGDHAPAGYPHQLHEGRASSRGDVQAGVDAAVLFVQLAVEAERAAARRGVQRSVH